LVIFETFTGCFPFDPNKGLTGLKQVLLLILSFFKFAESTKMVQIEGTYTNVKKQDFADFYVHLGEPTLGGCFTIYDVAQYFFSKL
jgi:hypothetical protein